jgi:hypothetical protein
MAAKRRPGRAGAAGGEAPGWWLREHEQPAPAPFCSSGGLSAHCRQPAMATLLVQVEMAVRRGSCGWSRQDPAREVTGADPDRWRWRKFEGKRGGGGSFSDGPKNGELRGDRVLIGEELAEGLEDPGARGASGAALGNNGAAAAAWCDIAVAHDRGAGWASTVKQYAFGCILKKFKPVWMDSIET